MNWDKALKWAATVSVLAILIGLIRPMFPEADRMGPRKYTSSKLWRLARCMSEYHFANGDWPATNLFETQLRPYLLRESSRPEELLSDVWGNKMRYVVIEGGSNKTQRLLYSFGPNRQDEHGTGDDIVVPIPAQARESK